MSSDGNVLGKDSGGCRNCPTRSGVGFRKALLTAQIAIIAGLPVGAFVAELTTDWKISPPFERMYYVTILATLLSLGILRWQELRDGVKELRDGGILK